MGGQRVRGILRDGAQTEGSITEFGVHPDVQLVGDLIARLPVAVSLHDLVYGDVTPAPPGC